ncbi:hypothetical protein DXT87_02840 [Arthrobacter sp. AET 35A]|nr:hypothetical protein [Arthrobacter sp. AET 35A]
MTSTASTTNVGMSGLRLFALLELVWLGLPPNGRSSPEVTFTSSLDPLDHGNPVPTAQIGSATQ